MTSVELPSSSDITQEDDFIVPIPIQTFFWGQTCPFIRPRLGKLHEATCVFCQNQATHHEIREACKSLEKVLVQNIQFGLSPSLTEAIKSVPRWRMIQTAVPHVMHCAAQLLVNRKQSGIQTGLGAAETKLLYTLHWILMDCAEECADSDYEKGIQHSSSFHFVFPISTITLFVYLFAPICHHLRSTDFNNFRLENGNRLWPTMWGYKTPELLCFTCPVKPQQYLNPYFVRKNKKELFGDVFVGGQKGPVAETPIIASTSTPPPTPEHAKSGYVDPATKLALEAELEKLGLPTGPFPETIPEESSSNEEEHVMIFRLGSIPEAEGLKEGTVFKVSHYPLQMPVRQSSNESSKASPSDKTKDRKGSSEFNRSRTDSSPRVSIGKGNGLFSPTSVSSQFYKTIQGKSIQPIGNLTTWKKQCLATFMDVAVMRCLFVPHWEEEGVYWGLSYLLKRFEEILILKDFITKEKDFSQRPRSKSLPASKPNRAAYLAELIASDPKLMEKEAEKAKLKISLSNSTKAPKSSAGGQQFISYSACSSPTAERRSTSRRGSERGAKKKLTMSDLRAFVETKLLSKSEKMLEKLGALEKASDSIESKNGHDDPSIRPQSALGHHADADMDQKTVMTMGDSYFAEPSSLFKGKSMPSLSCLLGDELAASTGYIGIPSMGGDRRLNLDRSNFPNPIITVTEHTPCPTPSPERMYRRRASSVDSQLCNFVQKFVEHGRRGSGKPRKRYLGRSNSDSKINYVVNESSEAPGTGQYITKDGELNPKILIKAIHQITGREPIVKSVRICIVALGLLDLLFNQVEKDEEVVIVIDTVTKIITSMGCTHGCGEARKCSQSDTVRTHAHSTLLRLSQKWSPQFSKYYQRMVTKHNLTTVMDFFHSLCGFCIDPTSLLSPLTSPKIRDFYASWAAGNNGQSDHYMNSTVESKIFKAVFKKLVSRLAAVSKELRNSDNMVLYTDTKQFIAYVYENDGHTFRKVALSALIDSMERENEKDSSRQTQTTRIVRRLQQSEDSGNFYVVDETQGGERSGPSSGNNNKKGFFKKKISSSSTCASVGDADNIIGESPCGTLRKHATLTPKSSEIDLVHHLGKRAGPSGLTSVKKESRLVNWLKRGTGTGSRGDKSFDFEYDDVTSITSGSEHKKHTMRQATIVQRAKRRVEERLKRIKMKRDSTNDEHGSGGGGMSRRGSLENISNENVLGETNEFVVLKERRLVNPIVVRDGLLRFGFLLEITHPGSLPDANLMAALMDLPKTVVVSRACILMECCYLVHACNRGHWPLWMKLPMFRQSVAGISLGLPNARGAGSIRSRNALQKASGKMFHQWGEALHIRLEEYIRTNKTKFGEIDFTDDAKQKEFAQKDEEEDYLDESSIADGLECPVALQIVACMLLFEITSFTRETYQSLPKIGHVTKPPPEKESKPPGPSGPPPTTGGGRRWSYGLASMGQTSHSLQSIADQHGVAQQGERKISFVLQDNESGESGERPHIEPDQNSEDRKLRGKVRPLLLRRGTPAGSSFRKRSIKLQKANKKEQDQESMKRSDSITSGKRKVSSISDDTSEQNSGDESPGIMSNEDQLAEDEALYMPWLSTVIEFLSGLNYKCLHQEYCHPLCPRRVMRAVSRLLKGVRKIYGEEFGLAVGIGGGFPDSSVNDTPARNGHGSSGIQSKDEKDKLEEPAILKYIKQKVQGGFHALFSQLIKAASVLTEEQFVILINPTWELLLEPDIQISSCSAALFILAGVKAPEQVKNLMQAEFEHKNPENRLSALLKFQMLWKCRHQVWPRMEENTIFKAPPPGIEFTLPSPRIGVECIPVVDPPWMPLIKTKVEEEVTLNQESHISRRYLVTATKTRKTQQAELVKLALQAKEDKKRTDREQFLMTAVPIIFQASFEPSIHHTTNEEENDDETAGPIGQAPSSQLPVPGQVNVNQSGPNDSVSATTGILTKSAHNKSSTLFPSSLCSAAPFIIQLLDDPAVTLDGIAVYEISYQVLWSCLVEDCSLFLRYVYEKLTRGRHEYMFKILRHLIMFVPRLPQQAAFSLYNHIIGFIMFHTRQPQDTSSEMIGSALSVLWMVVHSVQGIMFKDLKQILRKEQADASILLTANVPAAKKIIVHGPLGPESGGIPTQFPVQEDTQFIQILRESHDFFSIDEEHHKEYFLIDHKTHQIHNPNSYVRDFYFFSRAQHPQLSLVHMAPDHAYSAQQRQAFILKFLESGKVTLTWAILKNVDQVMQRVVFLHEELMKLPSFPRKALESDMDISKGGMMGRELLGLDVLHKFMWTKLITRMFEAMSGNFAYSGDIHLFINVLSGSLFVHSEDASIIRYIIAAFINAAQQFKNIFSTNGYLLIMPPLLLTYCNHQSNPLVTGSVEFAVKEFYLLHRKPFVLQMFGALAALLDTDEKSAYGDPTRVPSKCLFRLLLSLETPTPDPLHITELIHGQQPLRPLDFCYHDDSDEITVLDCISMCVCVVAYASDSLRGQQMLTILEAVLPPYLTHIQTNKTEGKSERDIINHIAVAIRTLVNNCEPLAKNYSGPQMSSPTDMRGSSQRNFKGGGIAPGYDFADDDSHSKYMSDSRNRNMYERENQDSEGIRDEFRRPRGTLLCLVSDFFSKTSARLLELAKKGGTEAKPVELLDMKSHIRLSEVAMSLLKVSPYDPQTMGCHGLQRYINEVFPYGDWAHESTRPALTAFLRRVDKTFIKICKKPSIRRHADWEAAAGLLKGIYQALWRHPYMVHMQYLKSLVNTCQCLLIGEGLASELRLTASSAALMGKLPPGHFCATVVRLLALHVRAQGDSYSLEQTCGVLPNVPIPQEKSDILLMNLLLPMCLRVGSGRRDVPKMRKSDIVFILNLILSSISPTGIRFKSPAETNNTIATGNSTARSGSISERKLRNSTCQIAFLGLKILCICFDSELSTEWARTVRVIQELGSRIGSTTALWDFLEFVITIRTSIYPTFAPLIAQKLSKPPSNDQERHYQFVIREKMRGVALGKCKGSLLVDISHHLKTLKEDLESKQEEVVITKKNMTEPEPNRRPRPSLSELFPSIAARFGSTDESKGSSANVHKNLNRESSVRVKPTSQGRMVDRFMRRVSIAGDAPFTIPENSVLKAKERSEETFALHTEGEGNEGVMGSQDEEGGKPPHRLQRQKFQSRKTFRFRKSKKGNLEFSSIEDEGEKSVTPESPLSPQPKTEENGRNGNSKDRDSNNSPPDDEDPSPDSKQLLGKNSIRIRSKRKKSNSPQNGGDCDSQNSFSRTSSTCGYRESFGSVERYSLQMLERLEVQGPDQIEREKSVSRSRKRNEKGDKGEDDEDTLI